MTSMQIGATTKFSEIYNQLSKSDLKKDQHVRGDLAGTTIYRSTNPLRPPNKTGRWWSQAPGFQGFCRMQSRFC